MNRILLFTIAIFFTISCNCQNFFWSHTGTAEYCTEYNLTDGLVAYYEFNEASGDLLDQVGTNDLTVVSATRQQSSPTGTYSYYFDGTGDDYITGTSPTSGISFSDTITMAMWIKVDAYATFTYPYSEYPATGTNVGLFAGTTSSYVGAGYFKDGGSGIRSSSYTGSDWVLLWCRWYYVGGTLYYEATYNDGTGWSSNTNIDTYTSWGGDGTVTIGRRGTGSTYGAFEGYIDNIMIWNKDISSSARECFYLNTFEVTP